MGARLNLTSAGTWSIPLNGIENFSVTASKDQLRSLERGWWEEMRTSVVVSWQREDGSLDAWVAGPIMGPPAETRTTATLACQGIGAVLKKRVLAAVEPDENPASAQEALAQSWVRLTNMSYGTIAQEYVRLATAKVGGTLPITFGSPRETGSALRRRNWAGWNLANNEVWKRLTELTRLRNGPDIQFRPRWTDDGFLEWVLVHGTHAQPSIAQTWSMDLDTTSDLSPVAEVSVTTDASRLASRVYWTGAGEGEGTLIRVVQDLTRLDDQMPLLEVVGSTSDSENPSLLIDHARGELAASAAPVTQVTVKIDGADPRAEIGRWRVGDAARLTLGDEWLTVPAGTTTKRIIAAKGDWASSKVTVEFQDDALPTAEDFDEEEEGDG